MTVTILAGYEQMSRQAADLFVRQARLSVDQNGIFCVAFAGGDTPFRTYELLSQKPWVDNVPWNQTHVFWGDERCVPQNDPRHNATIAKDILLSNVPIPETQIHPVWCIENPSETAEKYEALLRKFYREPGHLFDLVMLGVGTDGHIASLFPGTPVIEEREKWVREVSVPGQAFKRITLTFPALEKSAMIMMLVSGIGKAQVVKKILEGNGNRRDLPAAVIRPENGECIWLLDEASASLLKK